MAFVWSDRLVDINQIRGSRAGKMPQMLECEVGKLHLKTTTRIDTLSTYVGSLEYPGRLTKEVKSQESSELLQRSLLPQISPLTVSPSGLYAFQGPLNNQSVNNDPLFTAVLLEEVIDPTAGLRYFHNSLTQSLIAAGLIVYEPFPRSRMIQYIPVRSTSWKC